MLPKNHFITWSLEQHSQQQNSHQCITGFVTAYDKDGVGAPLSTITSTGIRQDTVTNDRGATMAEKVHDFFFFFKSAMFLQFKKVSKVHK